MVTFRNNSNNRRSNFRRSDRNYKSNGDRPKYGSNFSNNENFQRKAPGRNNHNAPKLIEKYNNLAREAFPWNKIFRKLFSTCNRLRGCNEKKVLREKLLKVNQIKILVLLKIMII